MIFHSMIRVLRYPFTTHGVITIAISALILGPIQYFSPYTTGGKVEHDKTRLDYTKITFNSTCIDRAQRDINYAQQLDTLYQQIERSRTRTSNRTIKEIEQSARHNGDDDLAQQLREFTYTRVYYVSEAHINQRRLKNGISSAPLLLFQPLTQLVYSLGLSPFPPIEVTYIQQSTIRAYSVHSQYHPFEQKYIKTNTRRY